MEEGFAFAGANAYMATEINHVSDVMTDLVDGYNRESLFRQLTAVRPMNLHKQSRIAV